MAALRGTLHATMLNVGTRDFMDFGRPDSIYVDSVRISVTPFTFLFALGVTDPENDEQDLLATMRMSPQHAKVFASILKAHLDAYENRVGPIELPAEMIEKVERPEWKEREQ